MDYYEYKEKARNQAMAIQVWKLIFAALAAALVFPYKLGVWTAKGYSSAVQGVIARTLSLAALVGIIWGWGYAKEQWLETVPNHQQTAEDGTVTNSNEYDDMEKTVNHVGMAVYAVVGIGFLIGMGKGASKRGEMRKESQGEQIERKTDRKTEQANELFLQKHGMSTNGKYVEDDTGMRYSIVDDEDNDCLHLQAIGGKGKYAVLYYDDNGKFTQIK